MADTMFKPFLVDAGFGPPQIGLWVGTWGTIRSMWRLIVNASSN